MITVKRGDRIGTTCGQRKDGSRAILWNNNEIVWYSKDDFDFLASLFWSAELNFLPEGV